jgi:hypothetical protein
MRTRTVTDEREREAVADEYQREGYDVVEKRPLTLATYDRGSLLAHTAVFFTLGFWTFGLANLAYAWYRQRKSHDKVRIEVRGE